MIEATQRKEGVRFRLHVTAGAKRNSIGGSHDSALRVSVTAAPEKGKANKAIVKLLAKTMGIRQSQIDIVAGLEHRRKTVLATEISIEEIVAWLEQQI